MTIAALWLAQVAAFAAGWLGPWRDAPERGTRGRVPLPIRMGVSLSLVLASFLILRQAEGIHAVYAAWVTLGMAASFVGDLVMAKLIPLPNRLIGGMVTFAVGHAFYVTAYASTAAAAGSPLPNAGLWLALAAYAAATVGGWWVAIRNPAKPTALNVGALVYGAWIGVMASFAFALAFALGGSWWLAAAGGLSFVASDFLIGLTEIRDVEIDQPNDWIWLTYVAGQMGIVYAAWA